jgi:DNA-binding NarL/FixJ family response regulator
MMKTLLVDDHALVREGLCKLLTDNGVEVVGTASNGAQALIKYEMLRPELVLMDIQMAECDGIESTRLIKKDNPAALVVMLTAFEDYDNLLAAMEAGADGYLLKNMEPASFIRQLDALAAGEMPLAPGLAERLLRKMSNRHKGGADSGGSQRALTGKQAEFLQLLAQGLTYKEIAAQLDITVATVRYHIKEILAKTRLGNRAQLIAHATALVAGEKGTDDK